MLKIKIFLKINLSCDIETSINDLENDKIKIYIFFRVSYLNFCSYQYSQQISLITLAFLDKG